VFHSFLAVKVSLDKSKANQKELDTVAVLQAIQKSKDKAKEVGIKKVRKVSTYRQAVELMITLSNVSIQMLVFKCFLFVLWFKMIFCLIYKYRKQYNKNIESNNECCTILLGEGTSTSC